MKPYTQTINEKKLKQTLISLSLINDMPVPQKLGQIKKFIAEKKWGDVDFIKKIQVAMNNLMPCENIKLKHVETVKAFPQQFSKNFEFRIYHEFDSIHQQIAIAYIIHSKDFLVDISKVQKANIKFLREKHDLTIDTNNFGNISYVPKPVNCIDGGSDIFRPFYYDWQEKWSEFVGEFDSTREIIDKDDLLLVLKIDFKKSYDNLNPCKLFDMGEGAFPKVGKSMDFLRKISQKYVCNDCNNDSKPVNQKIPYGGNVESHMIANLLILMKMDKIIGSINENFKVVKYIRYADDIAIFIKPRKDKDKSAKILENIKNTIQDSIGDTAQEQLEEVDLSKIINEKVIKEMNINKNKTEWYFVNKETIDKDIINLKDSYTSVSSIHALRMPEFLSDNHFELEIHQDKDPNSRTTRQLEVMKKWEKIQRWDFLPTYLNQDYIDKQKSKKNFMSYFIPLYRKSESRNHKEKMIEYLLNNTSFFKQKQLTIEEKTDIQKFNNAWYKNIVGWFMKFDLSNDIELVQNAIKNKEQEYGDLGKGFENHSNQTSENAIHKYIEFQGNKRRDPKLFAHSQLVKLIKKIQEMQNCKYKGINNEIVFNDFLIIDGQSKLKNLPEYWKSLKVNILTYFKEMYGSHADFLYWRFKHYLLSANNRVDFVESCSYMFKTLDKLSDLNSLTLNEVDIEYFGIIKANYLTYTTVKTNDIDKTRKWKNKEIDSLWQIRILCKILWRNGSFSTQTYTSHNEEHGDVLMLRFVELRRSIKEVRHFMHKHNFSIFAVIGSIYTHDLGMLFNGDVEALNMGNMKDIYESISNKVRQYHGRNSASIINEWLGSYLNISSEHTVELSNAAIGHEIGSEKLAPLNKNSMNNTLILSIIDVLDITYERSNLLSRKLSGTIASDKTIVHWLKHYCTKSISSYKYADNKFLINIKANRILFDNDEDIEKYLEPLIKAELLKWLEPNINKLLQNNNLQQKKIGVEITIDWNEEFPKDETLSFYRGSRPIDKEELKKLIEEHNNCFIKT